MFANVRGQRSLLATGVRTKLAFERLLASVDANVLRQVALRRRCVRTQGTLIRLLRRVYKKSTATKDRKEERKEEGIIIH